MNQAAGLCVGKTMHRAARKLSLGAGASLLLALMLAPPPATAMTSQELAAICSSFVTEIGADPSICIPSLFPRSAGSGESSSYAIEPKPGVILVIDPKPWNCGGGIYVVPGSPCPRQPKGNRGLGIRVDGPVWWAKPPRSPAAKRKAAVEGSMKRCMFARETLREANDALKYLKDLQNNSSAWDAKGNLLDLNAASILLAKWDWWQPSFTPEVQDVLLEKFPNFEKGSFLDLLIGIKAGWELTKQEVEKDLKSPVCDNGPGAGKAKPGPAPQH